MNHLGGELAAVLDAPHFAKLLSGLADASRMVDGVPVDAQLAERHASMGQQHGERVRALRRVKFIMAALEGRQRASLTNALRMAECSVEFPFAAGMAPINTVLDVSKSLQDMEASVLPAARLLLSGNAEIESGDARVKSGDAEIESVDARTESGDARIEAVNAKIESVDNVIATVRAMDAEDERARDSVQKRLSTSLLYLVKASDALQKVERDVRASLETATPIAEEYVGTFAQYMAAVVESLHLKLQIIEMETRLSVYTPDLSRALKRTDRVADEIIRDLDQTIKLGRTNLMLFQQLGPAVAKIAAQYQQLLCQIELVKEDIQQLGGSEEEAPGPGRAGRG